MPDRIKWIPCSRCTRDFPAEEANGTGSVCPNCRDRMGVTELNRGRMDHYRQRRVAEGDPCDVCGSTDTRVKTVEDGYKPLCDEHYELFGFPE